MFGAEQDQERSTEEEEESPLQRQVENLFGSTGVLPWLEVTSRSSESGSNRGDNRPSEASLFLAMANAAAQRGENALPSATEERVQRLLQHQFGSLQSGGRMGLRQIPSGERGNTGAIRVFICTSP